MNTYEIEARGKNLLNIRLDGKKASKWATEVIEASSDSIAKSKAMKRFGDVADVIKVNRVIMSGVCGASICIGTKRRRIPADGMKWGVSFENWKVEDYREAIQKDKELEDRIEKWKADFHKK